jgi:hypothetical protein
MMTESSFSGNRSTLVKRSSSCAVRMAGKTCALHRGWLSLVSSLLTGMARMEGMVVDDEEDDAAVELIVEDRQVYGRLGGSWLYTNDNLGLAAYLGQRHELFVNIHIGCIKIQLTQSHVQQPLCPHVEARDLGARIRAFC